MLSLALVACLVQTGAPILRTPDIHGNMVAFSCEGDIWVGDLASGRAHRLTSDPGLENRPRFSPDGTQIAFSGQYDGPREVYVMPTDGGAPHRITHRNDYADCLGWTPDGGKIAFRARSVPRSYGIFTISARGGVEHRLPLEFAASADLDNSQGFLFTRFNRQGDAWFNYKGGMQNQIWLGNPAANHFSEITNLKDTCEYPTWAGGRVCFVQQTDATFTVWSQKADGSDRRKLAGPYDFEVKELHGDGDKLIYEKGPGIEMVDMKTGKVSPVTFDLHSDMLHTVPYDIAAGPGTMESVQVTSTGKRVLGVSRGQILSLPIGDGEARVWKSKPGVRFAQPRMSYDAKKIGYVSDESGEQNVYTADADGSNEKLVTTKPHRRQIMGWRWSPDGKWMAVSDSEHHLTLVDVSTGDERSLCTYGDQFGEYPVSFSPDSHWITFNETDKVTGYTNIAIYDIEKSQKHEVGLPLSADGPPSFGTNGRYLAFTTVADFSVHADPSFNQIDSSPGNKLAVLLLRKDAKNPLAEKDEDEGMKAPENKPDASKTTTIDFDGLYDRKIVLPVAAGAWSNPVMVGDRVISSLNGQVVFYDLAQKKQGNVTAGGGFQLTDDGKKLLVADRLVDANAENAVGGEHIGYGGLRITIEPVAEWKEIYWDAWRLLRDWFYVANMNGLDWNAIGRKYAAFLPSVRSRWELDELIRWLQAEMGCSHEYLSPGDNRLAARQAAGGYFGIDTASDPSGFLKITKVYRGDGLLPDEMSPLAAAGIDVKNGSYLLEVAGEPMTSDSDYRDALAGRVGQPVSILVNDTPNRAGARRYIVKPVALGADMRIRQVDYVESNRRYVEKASGGKIAYLHLWAMTDQDMSDFIRQYFPQRNREALIVDTRFNNGGYTQDFIIRILNEKLSGYFNFRNGANWTRQQDFFAGPMACMINEFNVSCGEEFPYHFRDLKLGPLIGRRTYGGEVGSGPGWKLMDGGVINVPDYGMWAPSKGWVIEAQGVAPDPGFDVPSDPNKYIEGHDPQLDRAVEYLLDEVRKHPVVRPVQPTDPIRVRGRG